MNIISIIGKIMDWVLFLGLIYFVFEIVMRFQDDQAIPLWYTPLPRIIHFNCVVSIVRVIYAFCFEPDKFDFFSLCFPALHIVIGIGFFVLDYLPEKQNYKKVRQERKARKEKTVEMKAGD